MKHLVLKTKYVVLALLVAFSFSCSPKDGAPGLPGAAGADGAAGQDGNANVQVVVIDMSAATGTFDDVAVTQITQDVIDNDVVLGYIRRGTNLYPVPTIEDPNTVPFGVSVEIKVGVYTMDYVDGATGGSHSIAAGDIDELKVVIIEATSSVAGRTSNNGRQQVYNELAQAGVNINDYYAVCDFYGIDY